MVTFPSNYKQAVPDAAGAGDGSLLFLPQVPQWEHITPLRDEDLSYEQIMFSQRRGSLAPKNVLEKSGHATADFIWNILENNPDVVLLLLK